MRRDTLVIEPESLTPAVPPVARPWWATAATLRMAVLTVLVLGLAVAMIVAHPTRASLIHVIGPQDAFAPLIAIGGTALMVTALLPRTLLAVVGGLLFGWGDGTLYVLAGVVFGSVLAYGVGRLLGREFMARHLRGRLRKAEQAVACGGVIPVVISRMIPLVPFGIANYVFGTTSVRLRNFVSGTLIGAFPATIAYAALGSATAHGNKPAMAVCGGLVLALSVGGSIGTYFVWRRRPRTERTAERAAKRVVAAVPMSS